MAAVFSSAVEGADGQHQGLLRREDRAIFSLARALHHLVRSQRLDCVGLGSGLIGVRQNMGGSGCVGGLLVVVVVGG